MSTKKQLEPKPGELSQAVDDWFRQFLKVLEFTIIDAGQDLAADANPADYALAALHAVKVTLLDSGLDDDTIMGLFGRVALERPKSPEKLLWSVALNRRRFELIDKDIQGALDIAEQLELAGLTQLMREHIDSENNIPLEGARKLYQQLSGFDRESTEPDK